MSNHNGKPDIQAALTALKDGFAQKVPAKIEEIRQSWNLLKSVPEDIDMFHLLHRQTHTLAGTAGTYGFHTVGQLAKAVEIALQADLTESHESWTPQIVSDVELLVQQLENFNQAGFEQEGEDNATFQPYLDNAEENSAKTDALNRLLYLVDDDADFLNTMAMQIRTFGYKVVTFTDLDRFEKAVALQEPALVIMDVEFEQGKKAGIEHIHRMNEERENVLQTIFITGSNDVLTRLDAVRAGGLGYFAKPLLVEKLVDSINDLTHQHAEETYKVVIVDDSPEQSSFAALTLQQAGMETREVNEPLELLNVLNDFPPDIILTDIYMPGCSGLELSKMIRQMDTFVSIPIVFLSSENDQKKQMNAMSLGGDDFLSKPIQPWYLVSAVTSRIKRGRKVRELAETDGLTGLLNHTKIKERLEEELSRAKREKTPLAFAMLDIDFFKHVNDSYGHPAGDRVLKSLANLFKQRLRKYDIVGRYGGEEFVVIFPNTDAIAAKTIMDKLRVSFSEISHFSSENPFYCRFSCGISAFPGYENGTEMSNEADKVLYEAKEGGRNKVVVAVNSLGGFSKAKAR